MSDISFRQCRECGEPEYACLCDKDYCRECGVALDDAAPGAGRDICSECYMGREE